MIFLIQNVLPYGQLKGRIVPGFLMGSYLPPNYHAQFSHGRARFHLQNVQSKKPFLFRVPYTTHDVHIYKEHIQTWLKADVLLNNLTQVIY